ncbi:hypothetical protein LPB142_14530 [Rhodobacter xanthinilyticus]|uniref:NAD-dependent epimerase/dehydratase domain-containing protein n=1 Tax=Rhodobacter xanthinilyticus TaxID=1850250 RepID=A0A1D9MF05_9RHOB|nr:NAD-dependent epimerase/dehydratase family protein [Rhodobacter xanthinilyticus]AOZ70393.1 hypothetical protein LPB142_14530 [Rhodobacter xanthinilyticus]
MSALISPPPVPRLLILGGTGRLGGLLRRAWGGGAEAGIAPVWQTRGAAPGAGDWLRVDPLAEPEALAAAARAADVILCLSGVTAGDAKALSLNVTLAEAAVAAAEAAGRPVFLASSAAVYGAGAPPGPEGWAEGDALAPAAPYGAAKAAMEAACGGRPGIVILRIGNVAGADALLGRAAPEGGRGLDIFADGIGPRRAYIGPQALARALARLTRLAAAGADLPAVINLALPGTVAMEALLTAAGAPYTARPAPPGAIAEVALDCARAVALGLVPEAPVRAPALIADLMSLPDPES